LTGQLEGMPVVVWTTDRDLRLSGSAGGGLVSLGVPPGRLGGAPIDELFRGALATSALVHAHRLALAGETVACQFETDDGVFRGAVQPLREGGRIAGVFGIALEEAAGWLRGDVLVLPGADGVIDL